MRRLLLVWLLGCWPVFSQEATLRTLSQQLGEALTHAQGVDETRRILRARLEIMRSQADELLNGHGDLEAFFRFYETTRSGTVAANLPPALQQDWGQVQALMDRLARETHQGGARPVLDREGLQHALEAAGRLENSLPSPPETSAQKELGQLLQTLQGHLQQCLDQFGPGTRPPAYSQVLHDRRRFYVLRGSLQLPAEPTRRLEQALEALPR